MQHEEAVRAFEQKRSQRESFGLKPGLTQLESVLFIILSFSNI